MVDLHSIIYSNTWLTRSKIVASFDSTEVGSTLCKGPFEEQFSLVYAA